MMQTLFDRSRHEAWQKCPRLRFLEYEYPTNTGVNGICKRAAAVPLLTGSMVHKGIELILNGHTEGGALATALTLYNEEIAKRGIETDDLSPKAEGTIKVQRALIEALISGWAGFVYPRIEAEFEILEVEREERATFPTTFGGSVTLMARTDCVIQRRSDGAIFVRNFKTISEATDRRREAFIYDTQTISELLAVEQRLQRAHEDDQLAISRLGGSADLGYPPQVAGVIYDLLVKGPRKVEWEDGWHNNSPLIWCYMREGQTGLTDDAFAARYFYECDAPHAMGRGYCDGGKTHSLGRQWHRKLVTEVVPGGINGWMNWLQTYEPGLIDDQFITLEPILRTPFDVETWKRSVLHEEAAVAEAAAIARDSVRQRGFLESLPVLDQTFPKHTHNGNCIFPTKCPMFDACWGAAGQNDDLRESEAFMHREPNHPEGESVE